MKNKKRKNRVILAICSMFIAVMSIFAFIPNNKEIVKADTVNTSYEYNGSNLYYWITIYNGLTGYTPAYIDGVDDFFAVNFNFGTTSSDNILNRIYISVSTKDNAYTSFFYRVGSPSFGYSTNLRMPILTDYGSYSTEFQVNVLKSDGTYNTDLVMSAPVKFFIEANYTNSNHNAISYLIRYFDKENRSIQFSWTKFISSNVQNADFLLIDRTYYLINPYADFSDNEYYNLGYSNGYDKGNFDGKIEGQRNGYDSGYINGKNDGYNLGYNQGVENANSYTFDSLLSAVIDVPVKTFTSLFNFEILGVNLSGFFLGLLTCCIVITIIRLIL